MRAEEIEEILKPLVEDLGYELWGCEYLSQGRHSLLRLYIESANGIGIEDCERVSKQVSAFLDVEDPIPGNYYLEVSSPGIARSLFHPEQYTKYLGAEVNLKLHRPIEARRKWSGILVSANEELVTLKVGEEEVEIPFSHIMKANLIGE